MADPGSLDHTLRILVSAVVLGTGSLQFPAAYAPLANRTKLIGKTYNLIDRRQHLCGFSVE